MTNSSQDNRQIVELQSLRGIAAFVVMLGHCANYYALDPQIISAARVFNGRAAVVFFFVLSGFVLTRSLARSRMTRPEVSRFYIRRLARIYPAICVVSAASLIYLVLLHWKVPTPDTSAFYRSRFRIERLDLLHVAASFAGVHAFLIPQLWSVFVELVASVAMPFIAFAAYRRRLWLFGGAAGALAASYLIGPRTYYLVGLYGFDFFVGAWLATAPSSLRGGLARLQPLAPALLCVLAPATLATQFLPGDYYDPTAALVEAALACAVIALVVYSGVQVRLLRAPATVFAGEISYSLYLSHFLVMSLVGKALGQVAGTLGWRAPLIAQALILTAITACLSLAVSILLYRTVELPGIRLGKWLTRARAPQRLVLGAREAQT